MRIDVECDKLLGKLNKISNLNWTIPITKACLLVENEAKQNAPVGTGELRSSITHEIYQDYGEVGTSLFYAPYVEYGTGLFSSQGNGRKDVPWRYQDAQGNWHSTCGQKPQPFLIPAYEHNKKNILKEFENYIKEELG